jgi:hypothetical protein
VHGNRVHAVAQPGGGGSVIEDVAQMSITQAARDCGADHHEASVDGIDHVFRRNGLPEAGPSSAGIELGCGVEQGQGASDAAKKAAVVDVP